MGSGWVGVRVAAGGSEGLAVEVGRVGLGVGAGRVGLVCGGAGRVKSIVVPGRGEAVAEAAEGCPAGRGKMQAVTSKSATINHSQRVMG